LTTKKGKSKRQKRKRLLKNMGTGERNSTKRNIIEEVIRGTKRGGVGGKVGKSRQTEQGTRKKAPILTKRGGGSDAPE